MAFDIIRSLRLFSESLPLLNQFERLGELKYVEKAINLQQEALELTPEGDSLRHTVLGILALSFQRRFAYHIPKREDIDKSINYYIQAIRAAPDSELAPLYGDLGTAHHCRFLQYGQAEDLKCALSFKLQAICRAPRDAAYLPFLFMELGMSLFKRFESHKDPRDIDHAIMCHKQSLIGNHHSEELPKCWMALGISVRSRFEYTNRTEDIDQSIKYLRLAAKGTPDTHVAFKAGRMNQLALSLTARYGHLGELVDLDESIELTQKAIATVPYDHPDKANCLNNLNQLLMRRFRRLDDLKDFDGAIKCQEESVELTPDDDPLKPPRLSILGNSLASRFNYLGDLSDLERSVQLLEKAVSLTAPDNVLRSRWLGNLGAALLDRYTVEERSEDIDASIELLTQATSLGLDTEVMRAGNFAHLGHSYMVRFLRHKRIEDIDNAITNQHHACSLIPESHVNKTGFLIMLAKSHWYRFRYAETFLDIILSSWGFHTAALLPSGKPRHRIEAALKCARISRPLDPVFSLKHYTLAMELLPQVVWLGTTVQRRYEIAPGIGLVMSEAAAAAIQLEEYGLALEWLEQGRSIVWQQTLSLRSPFDALSLADRGLAERLKEIARQLDNIGTSQPTNPYVPNDTPASEQAAHEKAAQERRRLAEEWDRRLEEVRRIPDFSDFMQPRKSAELIQAAKSGPVVVFNVHDTRCDALVLLPNSQEVTHVPLPSFSLQKAAMAYKQMTHSLQRKGVRERGVRVGQAQRKDVFESILSLLWSDVAQPVLQSLGYLQVAPTLDLPHITWCATGPLAFLPLHAAGCYSKPHERVYNYAVSSYTPTLSALLAPDRSPRAFRGILGIGQTNTPGFQSLYGTVQELSRIQQHIKDVRYTQLDEENATVSVVMDAIEGHSWVHFACHASQNASDPTASAFHLHDGALSLATIMKKSFKNADLAFLSACQTAKGDPNLPDEAVHLAAGMLMAGFPSVIATMWSIRDEDAPLVAEEVYVQLLEGGKPDSRRAAGALHKAVERLREEVGEKAFALWVPYVHLGI
ncbi:TPR-like protein [Ceratobasidium sp. AG-I]|nr:TPR-like protein [Ceratobasidium sp. AG-I]